MKIQKQIEDDRLARKTKMDAEIDEQKAAKQAEVEAIKGNEKIDKEVNLQSNKAEKLRKEAERLEEIRRQRDTTARIQVSI